MGVGHLEASLSSSGSREFLVLSNRAANTLNYNELFSVQATHLRKSARKGSSAFKVQHIVLRTRTSLVRRRGAHGVTHLQYSDLAVLAASLVGVPLREAVSKPAI